MRAWLLLAAVLLSGCGGGSPTAVHSPGSPAVSATEPSPTPQTSNPSTEPSPSLASLLVGIGPGAIGSGQPSSVELVNAAGRIVAKTSAKPRYERNVASPSISVTASRDYYLDSPSDISWLKPD